MLFEKYFKKLSFEDLLTIRFSNVLFISGVTHHAKTMKWLGMLFKNNKLVLEI